jgi:hypothetical protein
MSIFDELRGYKKIQKYYIYGHFNTNWQPLQIVGVLLNKILNVFQIFS